MIHPTTPIKFCNVFIYNIYAAWPDNRCTVALRLLEDTRYANGCLLREHSSA